MDTSLRVTRIPHAGETVSAQTVTRSGGGKGANQAVAAARAGGATTTLIARIGSDAEGRFLRRQIEESGVTALFEVDPDAPTGSAYVTVSDNGENSIVVVPGANASSGPLSSEAQGALGSADVVLTQLETPTTLLEQVRNAMRREAMLIWNAAPVLPLSEEQWQVLDLLIVNEHEAAELTGETDAQKALAALLLRVPQAIVTLGSKGSIFADRDGSTRIIDAYPVEPVDTTAAGDTFCGVVAAQLANHAPFPEAIRFASAAAALSVLRNGAQTSIPSHEETATFLSETTHPSHTNTAC
jgi:ribokinase